MTDTNPEKIDYRQQQRQRVFFDWLFQIYPNVFNLKNPVPLAIGVGKTLQEQLPENVSLADFKGAMAWYCRRPNYFKAVIKQENRIGLDGEIAEALTEADKENAKAQLAYYDEKSKKMKNEVTSKNATQEDNPSLVEAEIASVKPTEIETIAQSEPIETEVTEVKPKKLTLKRKTVEPEITPPQEAKLETAVSKVTKEGVAVAKGLKVTLVVDPASIPVFDSTGQKKVNLTVQIANTDIQVSADLGAKSYRKAISSIEELGAENCNAILQGSMKKFGVIEDAGLVVQPKKTATTETTES